MAWSEGSPWPRTAGVHAVVLGALVAAGSFGEPGDASQAMQLPAFSLGAGCLLVVAGALMLGGIAAGRGLYVWAMPAAAVALASNHPELLWTEDLPYTILGFIVHAPFLFFLSRPGAQLALGKEDHGWSARGGLNALLCFLAYGGLYAWVASSPVRGGGPDWPGFEHLGGGFEYTLFGGLGRANLYVAKKATALVLAWHAGAAFVAVSIPPGTRSVESARPGVSRPGFAILWVYACVVGGLTAAGASWVVQPASSAGVAVVDAMAVLAFAALQAPLVARATGTGPLRWIAWTLAGGLAGSFAVAGVFRLLPDPVEPDGPVWALLPLAYGAGLGAGQALGLRASAGVRWAWVAVVAAAGVAGWAFARQVVPWEDAAGPEAWALRSFLRAVSGDGLLALLTLALLWPAFERAVAPEPPPIPAEPGQPPPAPPLTRDRFEIIGFMKFYLVLHIVAPLFLIGLTLWAIETPGLELSEVGPLILVALGAYAIWHVARLIRWGGFHVVVTGEDITVGGTRVAWRDVSGVTVQTAFKFDTWIEIRPRTGEPLRIPAAIGKKNQLLTLVEKHHPDLERKT